MARVALGNLLAMASALMGRTLFLPLLRVTGEVVVAVTILGKTLPMVVLVVVSQILRETLDRVRQIKAFRVVTVRGAQVAVVAVALQQLAQPIQVQIETALPVVLAFLLQ